MAVLVADDPCMVDDAEHYETCGRQDCFACVGCFGCIAPAVPAAVPLDAGKNGPGQAAVCVEGVCQKALATSAGRPTDTNAVGRSLKALVAWSGRRDKIGCQAMQSEAQEQIESHRRRAREVACDGYTSPVQGYRVGDMRFLLALHVPRGLARGGIAVRVSGMPRMVLASQK